MKFSRLECVEREEVPSHHGTEIIRTFYCEPYSAHPALITALLGSFSGNNGTTWPRRLPAADSYWPNCYCTEAHVVQADKLAMTGSPSLVQQAGIPVNANMTLEQIAGVIEQQENPQGPDGRSGAFVRAIFQPLVFENMPERDYWEPFDFVDAQLLPLTKTVSCGAGLKILWGSIILPSAGSEGFLTQPMSQFSIRRIQCANVPDTTIAKLKGKINKNAMTIGTRTFPPETLRFDDAQVEKRAIPNADGGMTVWYDLLYVFTWNQIFEEHVDGTSEDIRGPDFVGWNRIFTMPRDPILGLPIAKRLSYYPVGWARDTLPPRTYRGLYMHDTDALPVNADPPGFLQLFDSRAT